MLDIWGQLRSLVNLKKKILFLKNLNKDLNDELKDRKSW
jgi:hypothetical protein